MYAPHHCERLAGLALALACAVPATAQTRPDDGRWDMRAVPYAWGAGVSGDARIRGLPTASIERSFRDTLSDLDMAGMLVVEARRGDWGLLSDLTHVETTQAARVPQLGIDGGLGNRFSTVSALASYRMIEAPRMSLDVLAGARRWDSALTLSLDTPVMVSRRADVAWTDPLLGLKLGWRPAPRHGLTIWAIGGASNGVPLDVLATYGFGVTPNLWLRIGYRHLDVRHRTSGVDVDLSIEGPGAGLEFRF